MADQLTDEELQQVMAASPRSFDANQLQPVVAPPMTQPNPSMPAIQVPTAQAEGQQPQAAPQVTIVAPQAVQLPKRQFAPVSVPTQKQAAPPLAMAMPQQAQPRQFAAITLPSPAESMRTQIPGQTSTESAAPMGIDRPSNVAIATPSITRPSTLTPGGPAPITLPEKDDSDPLEAKTAKDQERQAYLDKSGSGISQIFHPVDSNGDRTDQKPGFFRKLGGIAARVGDIAGSTFFPTVMMQIPGTELHHQMLMAQQNGVVNRDLSQQKAQQELDTDAMANEMVDTTDRDGNPVKIPQSQLANYISKRDATAQRGEVANARDKVAAAKAGFRINADGSIGAMDESELSAEQRADIAGKGVRDDLRKAQQVLADANAEVARQKVDPNSPFFKLALQRQATAQQNANAANTRASAYMGRYLQGAYNTGLNGEVLPGAPVISNDSGAQTVVGSTNAGTAIKNQSNAAQFNDVHGALDVLEGAARRLTASNGSVHSPGVVLALAQPEGTLKNWLQGSVAKAHLNDQERAYVQAVSSAHENIQALRKSAGGTATDSAVAKLDSMIPNASTPDLNYLLGQTSQIRATAERLGKGATVAQGGLSVRGQGTANQNTRPIASRQVATQPPPRPAAAVGTQKYPSGTYYVDAKGNKIGSGW